MQDSPIHVNVVDTGYFRSTVLVNADVKLVQITIAMAVELFVAKGDVLELLMCVPFRVIHPPSWQPTLQSAMLQLVDLVIAASTQSLEEGSSEKTIFFTAG
jgi:hypothetical protein